MQRLILEVAIFRFSIEWSKLGSPLPLKTPQQIQIIGSELALVWSDGTESYISAPKLRAASPSAETRGERDIFGQKYGGSQKTDFSAVQIVGWEQIGNYALRLDFSDGHRTGLYSYDLLLELAQTT